jgi:hypothetical protein
MKQNIFKVTAIAIFFVSLISSCTQDEGFGGNSYIKGVLVEKFYNKDFTVFQYERPAKNEDVYLMFGDEKVVGDDVETSITGHFTFPYLWPGNYQLYYYSDDTTVVSTEQTEVVHIINLERNQDADLGTLYTYKGLDWDEGFAKIRGKVMLINYKNESQYPNLQIKDISPAQEMEVYMTYNNAEFYTERIRTHKDGTFEFNHLLKGSYAIYVYSEDVITGKTELIVKEVKVNITELEQTIVLEDIIVEKI